MLVRLEMTNSYSSQHWIPAHSLIVHFCPIKDSLDTNNSSITILGDKKILMTTGNGQSWLAAQETWMSI